MAERQYMNRVKLELLYHDEFYLQSGTVPVSQYMYRVNCLVILIFAAVYTTIKSTNQNNMMVNGMTSSKFESVYMSF